MVASFRRKWQQENDPFSRFFLHNTHTIPMVFVSASAKRNGVFGLVTCRLDSYATLVGFNFQLKKKEWALLYLFREWSTPSNHKGFIQTGWSLVNPLLCCLSKHHINEITLCEQGLSCGIWSLDYLGTLLRDHQRNLGLDVSTKVKRVSCNSAIVSLALKGLSKLKKV